MYSHQFLVFFFFLATTCVSVCVHVCARERPTSTTTNVPSTTSSTTTAAPHHHHHTTPEVRLVPSTSTTTTTTTTTTAAPRQTTPAVRLAPTPQEGSEVGPEVEKEGEDHEEPAISGESGTTGKLNLYKLLQVQQIADKTFCAQPATKRRLSAITEVGPFIVRAKDDFQSKTSIHSYAHT